MKAWYGTFRGLLEATGLYQAPTTVARKSMNIFEGFNRLKIFEIFKSRFWTRNRPGDTIVDKTDESSMPNRMNERVTGIIFKNIELAGSFKV